MDQGYFFMTSFNIANAITWHHVDTRLDWVLLDEAWACFCHEHPGLVEKYQDVWQGEIEIDGENFVIRLFEEESG